MSPKNVSVAKLSNGRTMIVDETGAPVLVKIAGRPATSAPNGTRVKAALVAEVDGQKVPMPFAQATVGGKGYSPEFRLEMN